MVTVEYFHICDYAFPAQGGKPCIIGIFDNINAASFPARHPQMAVAMRLRGAPSEVVPFKVELGRPNGEVINTLEGTVNLGTDGSAFVNLMIIGAEFPEAGRYTFKVFSAGKSIHSHSLHLIKMQAPLQSAPPGAPPKQFH